MTYRFTYGQCGHTSGEANADREGSVPNEFCPSCATGRRAEREAQEQAAFEQMVAGLDEREYFVPSQEFVESLKVGDLAPCAFQTWRKVASISHRGPDVNGVLFVHYYVEFGPGSTLSHSIKVGRLERNMVVTGRHTSAELDRIAAEMMRQAECRKVETK